MLGYSDEHFDPDESERAELKAQDRADKARQRRLLQNPDCRDPDHPGCDNCMGDDDDEGGEA